MHPVQNESATLFSSTLNRIHHPLGYHAKKTHFPSWISLFYHWTLNNPPPPHGNLPYSHSYKTFNVVHGTQLKTTFPLQVLVGAATWLSPGQWNVHRSDVIASKSCHHMEEPSPSIPASFFSLGWNRNMKAEAEEAIWPWDDNHGFRMSEWVERWGVGPWYSQGTSPALYENKHLPCLSCCYFGLTLLWWPNPYHNSPTVLSHLPP